MLCYRNVVEESACVLEKKGKAVFQVFGFLF